MAESQWCSVNEIDGHIGCRLKRHRIISVVSARQMQERAHEVPVLIILQQQPINAASFSSHKSQLLQSWPASS
jgi:hypothetical protein